MMYGAQAWSLQDNSGQTASGLLKPLKKVQNKCLRRITGGYKRTPTAALEREAQVQPLDLYAETIALQRASATKDHLVNQRILDAANKIWNQMAVNRQAPNPTQLRRRRQRGTLPQPPTGLEKLWAKAAARENEVVDFEEARRSQRQASAATRKCRRQAGANSSRRQLKGTTLIARWAELEWRKRWMKAAEGKQATTWRNPWETKTLSLYEGLPKHQATALFLLRTEVLGLNAWLASVGVPDILPRCACGWQAQTVRHVILQCPDFADSRTELILRTGTEDLQEMLSRPKNTKEVAKWFVQQGILEQFNTAKEIEAEDATQYIPFQELDSWT